MRLAAADEEADRRRLTRAASPGRIRDVTPGLSPEDLDRLRTARPTVDPAESLFGPASVTWRVNREAVILLGGGRALLLQIAHPLVAAGVGAPRPVPPPPP